MQPIGGAGEVISICENKTSALALQELMTIPFASVFLSLGTIPVHNAIHVTDT